MPFARVTSQGGTVKILLLKGPLNKSYFIRGAAASSGRDTGNGAKVAKSPLLSPSPLNPATSAAKPSSPKSPKSPGKSSPKAFFSRSNSTVKKQESRAAAAGGYARSIGLAIDKGNGVEVLTPDSLAARAGLPAKNTSLFMVNGRSVVGMGPAKVGEVLEEESGGAGEVLLTVLPSAMYESLVSEKTFV